MLKVYNSLTKQKELFKPLVEKKISMYVCGMTVYDYCHLGHARLLMSFDMIYRYFKWLGYQVQYVRNITDIDDKIIKRANEKKQDYNALTDSFIDAMHQDEKAFNLLPPTLEPRATEFVEQMITMISQLIEEGYAYPAANGDVYYRVKAFADYGKLSKRDLTNLRVGERIEVNHAKQDPLDFVLWKAAKPGEPSWTSPWGDGRPGWHTECSAMTLNCLGDQFDLHGGGMDLMFPHHENEIAQAEAITKRQTATYWLHNGFLQINDEKMSKSLKNFITLREFRERHNPEVLRCFMALSHYRKPINYNESAIKQAHASLERLYLAVRGLDNQASCQPEMSADYFTRFRAAMDDDFNSPAAMAILFELASDIQKVRHKNPIEASGLAGILTQLANVFGLLYQDAGDFLKQGLLIGQALLSDAAIEALIEQRNVAREDRDWALADKIRDQLADADILLEDGGQGTTWRRG